ncbi:hypothetical protein JIQ42_06587 [Leishmania sp. Namibia]|uniref:hypothetical protein n=1 Tax=Leishmania sp. Namibia TaxID=2802991 RepID=UPI001B789131|nr:hypothetical protein JIQ42_06587 [Leishmania sp. Namibia]
MPIAADSSVSDSIAYLQDFVNQSGSSTCLVPTQGSPDTLRSGLHKPPAVERCSPPNISILSHNSSSALPLDVRDRLRRDGGGEEGRASIGADKAYSSNSRLGTTKTFVYSANDWRNDGVVSGASLLQRSRAAAASASAGYSPHIRKAASAEEGRAGQSHLPSFLNHSSASRSAASAGFAGPSSGTMFRYGKDSAAPPSSSRRNLHLHSGGAGGGRWAASSPPRASVWERRRASSFSSPPLYRRTTAATATTPAPLGWRRSSVPPPPVSGRGSSLSSLLWGWRDHSGEGAHGGIATAASPVPPESHRYRDKYSWEEGSARGSYVDGAPASHPMPPVLPASCAPPVGRAPRRGAAYEEVKEEGSSQLSSPPLRRPPLAPSTAGAASATTPPTVSDDRDVHPAQPLELISGRNPDEHASNVHRIAHYLKDYYAREAGETERGVESLSAEDVTGLAQCFYIDLYRTVRQARQAAGLETSSFLLEDPTESVIVSVARAPPPPPPQRERQVAYTPPQGAAALGRSASPSLPRRPSAAPKSQGGMERADARELHNAEVQAPPVTTPTSPPLAVTACASRQPSDNAALPSQPFVSAWAQDQQRRVTAFGAQYRLTNGSATSDVGPTYRAPNSQLAFSGGGTHPVQIITARLPAFRNDDATAAGDGSPAQANCRPSATSPVLRAGAGATSASRAYEEARTRGRPSTPAAAGRSALPHSFDTANSEAASSLALAAMPSPPYRHSRRVVGAAGAATSPATVQHHQLLSSQPQMSFGVSQHPPFSAPNGFAAALAGPSPSPRIHHRQGDTNQRGQHHRYEGQHMPLQARGRQMHVRDGFVDNSSSGSSEGSHDGGERPGRDGCKGPGGATGRATLAAAQEPSSGIVKRPLKDLMPLLRSRGTLIVKHIHHSRRPHLRHFQVLDCMVAYGGSEVLMPHLTWAPPAEVRRHDRLPRAKRSKHGAPLPTGLSFSQQEVPYATALNLIHLEAVYVGIGRGIAEAHMTLFRRARGGSSSGGAVVLDHLGRPVANGMCAVFVFASRPVAVSFLCEDDRQVWVGAMMGVVERNRTVTA